VRALVARQPEESTKPLVKSWLEVGLLYSIPSNLTYEGELWRDGTFTYQKGFLTVRLEDFQHTI
jgi:hypothetical protein